MAIRLLVCGGRDFTDADLAFKVLDTVLATNGEIEVVIQGGARGADKLAKDWAKSKGIRCEQYSADWDNLSHPDAVIRQRKDGSKYDVLAGHRRNQRMVDEGKPNLYFAFPGGTGTADMVERLRKAKISGAQMKTKPTENKDGS